MIDPDGEEVTGYLFGDNYYEIHVNGAIVARDPVGFVPFNSGVVRFKAKRPLTYAVKLVDWGTHLGVGMEYDRWNVGDGGFIARFSDGTETGAEWKCRAYYISPLQDRSCVGPGPGLVGVSRAAAMRGPGPGFVPGAATSRCPRIGRHRGSMTRHGTRHPPTGRGP